MQKATIVQDIPKFLRDWGKQIGRIQSRYMQMQNRLHCPSRAEFHCRLWTKLKQS